MILDTPENLFRGCLSPQWKEAEKFYRLCSTLAPGRYDLDNGVFAMVQEGTTVQENQVDFESHQKYTDLQIVLEGRELLVWSDISGLTLKETYAPKKDVMFFTGAGTPIPVAAGLCYVMHPSDGHKACCHQDKSSHYRKAVIKIPVNAE